MASTAKEIIKEEEHPNYGMTDEQLATQPVVYRGDLLAGKVALISGGGSGLGRAMAFLFSRLGAEVMICSRSEDKLKSTSASIKKLLGRDVPYQAMTIRDPEQVEKFMDSAWQRYGRVDYLVNNAGGQYPQSAIDFSVKGWNAVIDTNLNGTWYMMQAAARHWRDRGEPGCIVNIVANVGRGMPTVAHTCAARAGVIYLSKTVSTEWAPLNIRVNCVSPGAVETEGFRVYTPEVVTRFKDSNPMRRVGDAFDVAQAVVYLCAPSGKFMTGEVVAVDGGQQQWGEFWSAGIPDYFKLTYE